MAIEHAEMPGPKLGNGRRVDACGLAQPTNSELARRHLKREIAADSVSVSCAGHDLPRSLTQRCHGSRGAQGSVLQRRVTLLTHCRGVALQRYIELYQFNEPFLLP